MAGTSKLSSEIIGVITKEHHDQQTADIRELEATRLIASNNLSDINNAANARANLGVDEPGSAVAMAIALG